MSLGCKTDAEWDGTYDADRSILLVEAGDEISHLQQRETGTTKTDAALSTRKSSAPCARVNEIGPWDRLAAGKLASSSSDMMLALARV